MSRLARASGIQFGVQAAQTIIGFLAILYFANLLGASSLGVYFLALAIVNWLTIPLAGIRTAAMKRISEDDEPEAFLGASTAVLIGVTVIVGGGLVLGEGWVNSYVGASVGGLVTFLFLTNVSTTFLLGVIRARGRVVSAALIEGGWRIARPLLQAAFVLGGAGVVGLLIGEIIAGAVVTVGLIAVLARHVTVPRRRHFTELYQYGRFVWLSSVKTGSYSWIDTIVLGFFLTSEIVGVYEVAWRVTAAFILLPTAISKVMFQDVSRASNAADERRVSRTVGRSITFAGALAIPGIVGAVTTGEYILALYGEEFVSGLVPLIILSMARVAQSYETILLQSLNALGLAKETFRISALFVILNVVGNVALVYTVGPAGAAAATAGSVTIAAVLSVRALRQRIHINIDHRSIGVQVAAAMIMGVVIETVTMWRVPTNPRGTIALVAVGATVYCGILLKFSTEVREQLRRAVGS